MSRLRAEHAPISEDAWGAISETVTQVLKQTLVGRKLLNFTGPLGWEAAAVNSGRVEPFNNGAFEGVQTAVRSVDPLIELETGFAVVQTDLDAVARGGDLPDFPEAKRAALQMARAEDRLIFYGCDEAKMSGLISSSPHAPIEIAQGRDWLSGIARGVEQLRNAGHAGPYRLIVNDAQYRSFLAASEEGYPLRKRIIGPLLDGPPLVSSVLDKAVLLSAASGNFELVVGGDIGIGYRGQDGERLELFLAESMRFRAHEPDAVVALQTS